MTRRNGVPSYRKHSASQQAIVTLSGRDVYLGPYGSQVSKDEYDRVVGEWMQNGRRWPVEGEDQTLTISELIVRYWEFCEQRYQRDGKPTSEQVHIKRALKIVMRLYGRTLVRDFGPLNEVVRPAITSRSHRGRR